MQQVENIEFELKTNGFINVKTLDEITCNKPNYETGSASKLTLKPKANIAAVWKLDDTVDEEVETIDPDNLLDEDDFKKPDPASLRGKTFYSFTFHLWQYLKHEQFVEPLGRERLAKIAVVVWLMN